jgi:hypothetical protein
MERLISSSTNPWPAQSPWSGGVTTNPFVLAVSTVVRPSNPTLTPWYVTELGAGEGIDRAAETARALAAGWFRTEFRLASARSTSGVSEKVAMEVWIGDPAPPTAVPFAFTGLTVTRPALAWAPAIETTPAASSNNIGNLTSDIRMIVSLLS